MYKKEDYYVNQHSVFLLQYHLVLITKYRHPVITGDIKDFLIKYTEEYFKNRDMNILSINTDKDHMHILFECGPRECLSKFINAFKSASSRNVRKRFQEDLKPFYWKPYFWSMSYFIGTVSERSESIVKRYIENQGRKGADSPPA